MTDYTQWLQANDQFLAQAMSDLRNRLLHAGDEASARHGDAPPAIAPPSQARGAWLSRLFAKPAAADKAAASSDEPAAPLTSDADVPVPALVLLADRLGLSAFERQLLMLCVGMELDPGFAALCARAHGDPGKPWPTFALAFAVLDEPSWDALSPHRPLRFWHLLDIHQPGPQPLVNAALSADERVVNFVKGLNQLDGRLAPLLSPLAPAPLPPSQRMAADRILEHLRHAAPSHPLPPVQLLGHDAAGKQAIACAVAGGLGMHPYRLPAEMLPHAIADQETLIRLWLRESQLMPVALYLDAGEAEPGEAAAAALKRILARVSGPVFLDTREPWPALGGTALSVDVAKPTSIEQRAHWQHALGASAGDHPRHLAAHFDFDLGKIERVAQTALAAAHSPDTLGPALWQDALARTRPALDQLAQRIEPKATWEDLKLPEHEAGLLRQIADQVARRGVVYDDWGFRERMNRGLSVSALFAGESGTGKTMAAEVIANALDLSLYRIDLSAVVSKYIGETEKNLRRLFDAADNGGAILFFDEADALFGRRSEVKDSHDRYANIEVNYLLQRLETFRGLAILATNMKSALDSAFLRRIRFIVNFPFPGAPERKAIWASAFPPQVAVGALDLERLARLALTGGSIQGIALNAAFMAARAGTPVTMPLLLEAARGEFRKLEKPINEADFRWLESAGAAP
ncbi:ATP-binding protein [Dyella sp. BiH032]|uniref:ATP-binding protein n=1 Tax=Dyella sp. BiH032 TaxID=3075430 RepID=UPI0028933D6A|nr:ATP-binding protein [Dyella sp. BiH032]WNL45680.1 ATP-binding protein [Dyella sp. BiH032]